MVFGKVAVEEPTNTGSGVTEVGQHSSSSLPFTFRSSEESQVPIYCRVNRESGTDLLPGEQRESGTDLLLGEQRESGTNLLLGEQRESGTDLLLGKQSVLNPGASVPVMSALTAQPRWRGL